METINKARAAAMLEYFTEAERTILYSALSDAEIKYTDKAHTLNRSGINTKHNEGFLAMAIMARELKETFF